MRTLKKIYSKTNKFIKFLVDALVQISFFLVIIGIFEYLFVLSELSSKTPKKIIYIEAFTLYLLSKVSKSIVDIFKKNKENDESNDNDDKNDEDFFWLSK